MFSGASPNTCLGIDAGGTRTTALLSNDELELLGRKEFGPANIRLLSDAELQRRFAEIAREFPNPARIGIGMAGAREEKDRSRIANALKLTWGPIPASITHDLEIALEAAGEKETVSLPSVLVLSGTGSCCFGKTPKGKTVKLGGWGHILGDKGSGYEIGLRALKAVVYYLDRDATWSHLGQAILRKLLLNEPNDLIGWVQGAEKSDVADLTTLVFEAAGNQDRIALDILEGAAQSLAKDALNCASKLLKPGNKVSFILAGSVLLKQPSFAARVSRLIKKGAPNATVSPLHREAVWGAVRLGFQVAPATLKPKKIRARTAPDIYVPALALANSPTEQRNPRSKNLDRMTTDAGVRLMLEEESRVCPALLRHRDEIARGVDLISAALLKGGRLFYIGAGTSGRLGVLDASECPPTFRTSPEQVQGIIAGGQRALWQAVEGAEDDPGAGSAAVLSRGVRKGDVLVGIAASGRTPFVWGGIAKARELKAKTILLCFNPTLEIDPKSRPDLLIAVDLEPELLTGSTRLKSGTATKIVLNTFTTLTMVKLGKVVSNLMIDLNPSNLKLRDRAIRIVSELTDSPPSVAKESLEQSGWVVKTAYESLSQKGRTISKVSPARRKGRQSGQGHSGRPQKSRKK